MAPFFLFAFIINAEPLQVLPIIPFKTEKECITEISKVPPSRIQHQFACIKIDPNDEVKPVEPKKKKDMEV